MTKYIKYHKNYTEFGEPYQLVLPLNLEGLVPDDDSVRLLSHELEDLDYSLLYQAYSAKGRNPVVDPKTMFKILTYAYSQNIYSSRKIEIACKRDINFMWLLAGQKAPDPQHNRKVPYWIFGRHLRSPVLSDGTSFGTNGRTIKGNRIYRWYETGSLRQ